MRFDIPLIFHALDLKGWSVETLAKRSGVCMAYIYRLRNGEARNPTAPTMAKIVKPLGLTMERVCIKPNGKRRG